MNFASSLSATLSWMTVVGQLLSIVVAAAFIFSKNDNALMRIIKKHGLAFAFTVAVISVAGSLSYSDILGYEPCKLCWFQRIFMYPQVLILGFGLYLKDRSASFYALVLSMIGLPVAWFHYLIQLGYLKSGCSTVGYSVACSKVFAMNLGYITIPLMAFTAFLMNILFLLVWRRG